MFFWVLGVKKAEEFTPCSLFYVGLTILCGPGSSVSIVTDCGLDDLGSNPGGDENLCLSRPALWPNQPPVKWVPGLSRG